MQWETTAGVYWVAEGIIWRLIEAILTIRADRDGHSDGAQGRLPLQEGEAVGVNLRGSLRSVTAELLPR